ncbi:MAG: SpoIIIAH-like family protein [Ruminococcaceae bacterium]|nr:SpoIIIAH-like family protein [Oscillospiraceae bacterium]
MKKGKVLGKGQITVAVMLLALGAAIWLNTKYLPSESKYLGEASYVNNSSAKDEYIETSAEVTEKADYFTTTKKDREKARKEACETIEETLKNEKLTDDDKKSALAKIEEIADRIERESNIEALLSAKGFQKSIAVMNDNGITVVVKSDGLTSAQTLQIQDIVTSETSIPLGNIKIVPIA